MSTLSFCFIVSSYFTAKFLLRYFDRTYCCFVGALFTVINLFGLGGLYRIKDDETLIRCAFAFQAIGGIGNGISTSSIIAVLSSYKDKREKYIGIF